MSARRESFNRQIDVLLDGFIHKTSDYDLISWAELCAIKNATVRLEEHHDEDVLFHNFEYLISAVTQRILLYRDVSPNAIRNILVLLNFLTSECGNNSAETAHLFFAALLNQRFLKSVAKLVFPKYHLAHTVKANLFELLQIWSHNCAHLKNYKRLEKVLASYRPYVTTLITTTNSSSTSNRGGGGDDDDATSAATLFTGIDPDAAHDSEPSSPINSPSGGERCNTDQCASENPSSPPPTYDRHHRRTTIEPQNRRRSSLSALHWRKHKKRSASVMLHHEDGSKPKPENTEFVDSLSTSPPPSSSSAGAAAAAAAARRRLFELENTAGESSTFLTGCEMRGGGGGGLAACHECEHLTRKKEELLDQMNRAARMIKSFQKKLADWRVLTNSDYVRLDKQVVNFSEIRANIGARLNEVKNFWPNLVVQMLDIDDVLQFEMAKYAALKTSGFLEEEDRTR